jgi:hypothetical protein
MNIVEFAKDVLRKHLFDYEEKILLNYEERQQWSTFYEWVKPSKRENQYLMNIWLSYQEYLNGTLELAK